MLVMDGCRHGSCNVGSCSLYKDLTKEMRSTWRRPWQDQHD